MKLHSLQEETEASVGISTASYRTHSGEFKNQEVISWFGLMCHMAKMPPLEILSSAKH